MLSRSVSTQQGYAFCDLVLLVIHFYRIACSEPLEEALPEAPGLEAVLVKQSDGLI